MGKDRVLIPDLDEQTARLGRQWFAEIRQQERDEKAKPRVRRTSGDAGDGGTADGLWDWLTGDGDADGGDGGGD